MKAAQESVVAFCNESGIAFADVSYRRLSGKEPPLKRHMGTLAVQAAAILSLASCSLVSDVTDELAARIYGRKIGRAAGRERVGPSGEIAVVVGSLKNNRK